MSAEQSESIDRTAEWGELAPEDRWEGAADRTKPRLEGTRSRTSSRVVLSTGRHKRAIETR